ncbi:MAG: hypothetical protein H6600_02165 [Flavobacteriales bacterium]|nr:hypothetical protein [Flavobacteriales bacterium]MCB9197236.1 hypothetical protein [Flavobacteriales bacterium]
MKKLVIIHILILILISCDNTDEHATDHITDCYIETLSTKGIDYSTILSKTTLDLKKEGVLIGNTIPDLISSLNKMKAGEINQNAAVSVDKVQQSLHMVSLRGCVMDHKNDNAKTFNLIKSTEEYIMVYEFQSKEELNSQIQKTIDFLSTIENDPIWMRPFNILLVSMFYEEYKRIYLEEYVDQDLLEELELLENEPPPPVEIEMPAPPEPVEIIEELD